MVNPSFGTSFGLWEIISLALVGVIVGVIVGDIFFVPLGCHFVQKKKRQNTNLSPAAAGGEEERNDHGPANTVEVAPESEGDGWLSWLSSFWPGVHSLDQVYIRWIKR